MNEFMTAFQSSLDQHYILYLLPLVGFQIRRWPLLVHHLYNTKEEIIYSEMEFVTLGNDFLRKQERILEAGVKMEGTVRSRPLLVKQVKSLASGCNN